MGSWTFMAFILTCEACLVAWIVGRPKWRMRPGAPRRSAAQGIEPHQTRLQPQSQFIAAISVQFEGRDLMVEVIAARLAVDHDLLDGLQIRTEDEGMTNGGIIIFLQSEVKNI